MTEKFSYVEIYIACARIVLCKWCVDCMRGLCINALFAHKTYKDNKFKRICEVFAGVRKLLLRRHLLRRQLMAVFAAVLSVFIKAVI